MGGDDDLIALLEAAELGSELQRGDAVHDGKAAALLDALIAGKGRFELGQMASLGQGLGIAHGLGHDGNFLFRVAYGASAEIDSELHR